MVRKSGIPAFIAVNKADNAERFPRAADFYGLGLGNPWPVSALHGHGTGEMLDAITAVLPKEEHVETESLALAVVGRPNVGKSSLVNRLCHAERNIVTEVAGTTRDSTDTLITWKDNTVRLVDTAGLRRKSREMDDLEFYSTVRAWKSIAMADVVLVVMDATEYPVQQDIRIAARAWELGKSVIIGVNKIDLGKMDRDLWIKAIIERFNAAKWMPIMFFSALTGAGVGRIVPTAVEVGTARKTEMPTAELNRILRAAVEEVAPPSPKGRHVKLFYATQVGTAPPRVLIFVNHPEDLAENYRRYIDNKLREGLDIQGVPLRIIYRRREH
jgi:GTP-binding protein